MHSDKPNLAFSYSLWNKIVSIIIPALIGIPIVSLPFLVVIFIKANLFVFGMGIALLLLFFLIFDKYVYSIFSKSIVDKDALTYIPGGIFWKRVLKRQRIFPWEDYGFYLHYYDIYGNDDINYTMLVIKDRKGKIYLKLTRGSIANFEKLAEKFKEYCPTVELVEHTFLR